MSDLFWPGAERAGDIFSEDALLDAMVEVEAAWLHALVSAGVAPAEAAHDLAGLITAADTATVARQAEPSGNPVVPLLTLLRSRLGDGPAAKWLHRGLTSQDVLDTALALCLRATTGRLREHLAAQIATLARLAGEHRHTPIAGRTLTQHAIPITFGLKVATWLDNVLDARDGLTTVPAQFGGATGSLAAPSVLAGSGEGGAALVKIAADRLGLVAGSPWHTRRTPFTRIADALVTCTDAWGHIANDVLAGARPEIGELAEGRGGGSSTMPQKQNPVLSILIRRAALACPPHAALLHTAAASTVDERPDGAWHLEWATLRTLARYTLTAASQTEELLAGLRVFPDRMAATLAAARPGIDAEQRSMTAFAAMERRARTATTGEPATEGTAATAATGESGTEGPAATGDAVVAYLGNTDAIVDAALKRAGEPR